MGRRMLSAFLGLALACGGSSSDPPSVLLVVIDTVRADHTSTYGYARPTTIQLDALARAGVVFEDVTAPASWTYPSHASLFTGEPPWVHGAHFADAPPRGAEEDPKFAVGRLRPDLPTLAEKFGAAGYRTVSLTANEWLRPELGLVRGFERAQKVRSDSGVVSRALDAIAGDDPRPLFLFLNLMSAHSPYSEGPGRWGLANPDLLSPAGAPEWARPYLVKRRTRGIDLARKPDTPGAVDGITRYLSGELEIPPDGLALLAQLYDAGIKGADFALGRVLAAWGERHPNGIAIVTSDHGEALGEHGHISHMGGVYPELLNVPLVIAAPGRLPAGARVRAPVALQDLHPTLLDLAGIQPSPASLRHRIGPGDVRERAPRPIAAAAWPAAGWSRRVGGRYARRWNLYREGPEALIFAEGEPAELYDLERDPAMQHDLAAEARERVGVLLARARRHFGVDPARAAPLPISPETRRALSALGYGG